MRIINLIDNISNDHKLKSEHGLSYFVETNTHKILFDCGQGEAFIHNAFELNINLKEIDIVIISHGHYDHGGGLDAFLKLNNHAIIYLNRNAFNHYYSKNSAAELKYIGINQTLVQHPQIVLIDKDSYVIDEQLTLFSNINQLILSPLGNKVLVEKRGTQIRLDSFSHEQNLVIREDEKVVLMAGCAHNGIINIMRQISLRSHFNIQHVFGGFHLYNLTKKTYEEDARIILIARELVKTGATFYTGHCTGIKAYELLKTIMGNQIEYNTVGTIRDLKTHHGWVIALSLDDCKEL